MKEKGAVLFPAAILHRQRKTLDARMGLTAVCGGGVGPGIKFRGHFAQGSGVKDIR